MSSDLQSVIASSSIKSFNSGFAHGIAQENTRIIALLERDICSDWTATCCDGWCAAYKGAIDLIEKSAS